MCAVEIFKQKHRATFNNVVHKSQINKPLVVNHSKRANKRPIAAAVMPLLSYNIRLIGFIFH